MNRRQTAALAVCGLVLAGTAACSGGGSLGGNAGSDIRPVAAVGLPTTVGGLTVRQEQVAKAIKGVQHSYLDGLTFYTLRQHTNVEATLEVAHFSSAAPMGNAKFLDRVRQGVAGGISTTAFIDGVEVSQTSGLKSTISDWFQGDNMFILTVLQSYQQGRGLLENVVGQVHHAA